MTNSRADMYADINSQRQALNDSWQTQFSGFGGKHDKSLGALPSLNETLDSISLSTIWARNGIGRKIVSSVSSDMVRAGFTIDGDSDSSLYKKFQQLGMPNTIKQALDWQRLYGGSCILMGLDDGRKLDQPALPNARIMWTRVYSSARVRVNQMDLIMDPTSPLFEDYELFPVQIADGNIINVHRSRLLLFKGLSAPEQSITDGAISTYSERYWGISVIQNIYSELKWLGISEQGAAHLMQESSVQILKLKGLKDLLANKNATFVMDRLNVINLSKSLINSIVMDSEEEFVRNNLQYNGVSEIINLQMLMLSAVSEIPITRLYGRSPSGLNATGTSDLQNYYDMIHGKQETELRSVLQELLSRIGKRKDYTIVFNPVWTPSAEELIGMRKTQMETDVGYVKEGIATPEQIFSARFTGGYDLQNMNLEGEYEAELPDDSDGGSTSTVKKSKSPALEE